MVINIPGRDDLRIVGERNDWQVQSTVKKGKTAGEWRGTNFFPCIEHAVANVYERVLRESNGEMDLSGAVKECERVKRSLVSAVKKAVAGGDAE